MKRGATPGGAFVRDIYPGPTGPGPGQRPLQSPKPPTSRHPPPSKLSALLWLLLLCDSLKMTRGQGIASPSCPHCLPAHLSVEFAAQSDQAAPPAADSRRLDAIKQQILLKLGLQVPPNITDHLPRQFVMDTLYRAQELPPPPLSSPPSIYTNSSLLSAYISPASASGEEQRPREPPIEEPDEIDDFYGHTSEIITFAERGQPLNGQHLLEFAATTDGNRTQEPVELKVRSATLWLWIEAPPTRPPAKRKRLPTNHQHHNTTHTHTYKPNHISSNNYNESGRGPDTPITVWVFRLIRPLRRNNASVLVDKDFDQVTSMSASRKVLPHQLGWQRLDVTQAVQTWYERAPHSTPLRLFIDCSGCAGRLQVHLAARSLDVRRPFLVVHTEPTLQRRMRRRALDCSAGGALKGQCCKQRFYVSFKALGWDDWIIAPHGYFANYCRGACGGLHRTPDTFLTYYTHVIEELRRYDKLNGMQPCCAPLKFSSMSLIYFGPDQNIIKRDLPKMVVDECGCP